MREGLLRAGSIRQGSAKLIGGVLGIVVLSMLAWSTSLSPQPTVLSDATGRTGGLVVLLGTSGLRWSDVDPNVTPAIWHLSRQGPDGDLSVGGEGSSPCPVAGWMTLSAGSVTGAGAECTRVPSVSPTGTVNRWSDYRSSVLTGPFQSQLGLLADTLNAHHVRVAAIGPNAALAAASSAGQVKTFVPLPKTPAALTTAVRAVVASMQPRGATGGLPGLLLVDVGALQDTPAGPVRRHAAATLDARVAAVISGVPVPASIVLASMTDPGGSRHLQVLTTSVPGLPGAHAGLLSSRSTRQPGLVQLTDVPYTVLTMLGQPPPASFVGGELTQTPGQVVDQGISRLKEIDRAAVAVQGTVLPFFLTLVLAQIGLYCAAAYLWSRARRTLGARGRTKRKALLNAVQATSTICASIPVATFLANLVPWWRAGSPALTLSAVVVGFAIVVGAIAALGPWRRHLLGPTAAVCAITTTVLLADVLLGSRLQLSSLLGLQPLIGGRFYGIGNVALGVQGCATLLLAGTLAGPASRTDGRLRASALISMVGVTIVVADVAPSWGAKFGAVPVLAPALIYLAMRLCKVRVTFRRAAGITAVSLLILAVACVADYLRPPALRGHLGRFVASILNGQAGGIILRKAQQDLGLLGSAPFAFLIPIGLLAVTVFLRHPARWRADALSEEYQRAPELYAALAAILLAVCVGAVTNDTGVAIPPAAALLLLPMLVAIAAKSRAANPRPDENHPGEVNR